MISANRTVAWGEVARRLAHEIKNPLTPIQLSAERLAMKLEGKLQPAEAQIVTRSTNTIVNQVASLKQMVDEKVLLAANDQLGIHVPAQRVRDEILAIPAFQVDGVFNPEQYRMALQSNGLSPLGFEQRVRDDLGMRELPTQIGAIDALRPDQAAAVSEFAAAERTGR